MMNHVNHVLLKILYKFKIKIELFKNIFNLYKINMNNSFTNYDNITKALIYKQLNPPFYRIHTFNSNSFIQLSKAVVIRFKVNGKGLLTQLFHYDLNNKIVNYKCYYYSEEERKKDKKQNNKNWKKYKQDKNK